VWWLTAEKITMDVVDGMDWVDEVDNGLHVRPRGRTVVSMSSTRSIPSTSKCC
jgi:hypothetical protein